MPTWRDYYLSHDQRSSYEYVRRILKVMQWERGGERWVLKSPQHLEQFPALYDTFPDATFVVTHRDPVSVTASMITMLAYSARMGRPGGRPRPRPVLGRPAGTNAAVCVEQRDVLPAAQAVDVRLTTSWPTT